MKSAAMGPLLLLLGSSAPVMGLQVKTMTEIKEELLQGYDRNTRPSLAAAEAYMRETNVTECPTPPPEQVKTQFYLQFLTVNQKNLEYTVEGYFRVYWNDQRLNFTQYSRGYDGCVEKLIFGDDGGLLWVPDLYFEQVVAITMGKDNFGTTLEVQPNGDIFWSRQAKVTLRCPMHFGNLPFDTQTCGYMLGMWSQTAAEVVLEWKPEADGLANWRAVSTSSWIVTGMSQENQYLTYDSGSFTYAFAQLHLARRDESYVTQYVITAFLFVFVSYGGCWVAAGAVPARAAIAVISLIVVFSQQQAAKSQLPPFSYATWLTDFLFISALFNLIMFFEFVAVNYGMTVDAQAKAAEAAKAKAAAENSSAMATEQEAADMSGIKLIQVKTEKSTFARCWAQMLPYIRMMKDMDKTFRWLFPSAYILTVIILYSRVGAYKPVA